MQRFILIILLITLFVLGGWQIMRLMYKKSLTENLHAPAVTELSIPIAFPNYQPVIAKGTLLDTYIFLYLGGREEMYNLIGFFQQADQINLVNLGKITKNNITSIRKDWPSLKKEVLIKGNIIYPTSNFFITDSTKEDIWYNLNIQKLSAKYKLTLAPYILRSTNLPIKLAYLSPNLPITVYNPHLRYAILWFCLLAIAFFIFGRRLLH